MAEEEAITSERLLLERKYKQLRRHKHPFSLKYEEYRQEVVEEEEEEEHKLSLNEEHKYDGSKFPSCEFCDELILGPSYSCNSCSRLVDHQCGGYYLHRSCAQATLTIIKHPIHPHHPLTFFSGFGQKCDSCIGTLALEGFTYRCYQCNFYVDIKCAFSLLEHKIVNTSIHQHPLISLGREALLLCDVCGTQHKGFFYVCTTCMESGASSVVIHRNCALLPSTIKHRHHPPHHLNLSYSLPTQYSQFGNTCKICSKWINPKYWIYYCGGCRYFAHVHCATLLFTPTKTSKRQQETSKTKPCCQTDTNATYVDPDVIRLPLPDESISVITHLIRRMTLEDDKKGERIAELHHHSHNHPLILHDVQSKYNSCSTLSSLEKNNEICNLCTKPILNAQFYNCAQCSFSLHEFCAELPTEVRYPGHPQHSLILCAKSTTSLDWSCCHYCQRICSMFRYNIEGCECKHCSPISDDFAFYCASCKFYVHIKCALSPGAITHESHPQHVLLLKEEKINWREAQNYGSCNACGYEAITGSCYNIEGCSFKLHILCAYLPRRVEHRYDKHPFTLTYSPLEDHPIEYRCEICEEEVDPKYWFYHCVVCDQSLHIGCILEMSSSGYCMKAT